MSLYRILTCACYQTRQPHILIDHTAVFGDSEVGRSHQVHKIRKPSLQMFNLELYSSAYAPNVDPDQGCCDLGAPVGEERRRAPIRNPGPRAPSRFRYQRQSTRYQTAATSASGSPQRTHYDILSSIHFERPASTASSAVRIGEAHASL